MRYAFDKMVEFKVAGRADILGKEYWCNIPDIRQDSMITLPISQCRYDEESGVMAIPKWLIIKRGWISKQPNTTERKCHV